MMVSVVGRHIALSADQVSHAEDEAEKLGKFFDGVNEIKITFEREHNNLKAEIVCLVSGGKTLVAIETAATVHESLEFASDNMARQIKKYKAKLHDHRPPRSAAAEQEETGEPELPGEEEGEEA